MIWSARGPAAENMAVDEAVSERVAADEAPPTLRIYGWAPPGVSLGSFQALDEAVNVGAIRRRGYDLVRRPTGGRAIIHHDEVTYSVAIRADALCDGGSVVRSYREISRGIEVALTRLGVPAHIPERRRATRAKAHDLPAVCFAKAMGGDMVVDGRKIVGSAQMRRAGTILQHGSIPIRIDLQEHLEILGGSEDASRASMALGHAAVGVADAIGRDISFEELGWAVAAGFAEAFEIELSEEELAPDEVARAAELVKTKYSTEGWNLGRSTAGRASFGKLRTSLESAPTDGKGASPHTPLPAGEGQRRTACPTLRLRSGQARLSGLRRHDMRRVAKLDGVGNIVLEEADVPEVGPRDVLVRVKVSLISRGSELGGRYLKQDAVEPGVMGYAAAGEVAEIGSGVTEFAVGDRVAALKPHAEFVVADVDDQRHRPPVVKLPEGVSLELGTFWPFGTSGTSWAIASDIEPGDTVVVVGQGLVGSVMMQIVRRYDPGQVIAIDALEMRCEMARKLGADEVINAAETDPAVAVRELTGGKGARVVLEAVGGKWAASAFAQMQDMVAYGGNIVLIGLYQGEPLPLDAGKAMSHRIIGANSAGTDRTACSEIALGMLANGEIKGEEMITHRFPADEAKGAFDLLYERPGEALGVILVWE